MNEWDCCRGLTITAKVTFYDLKSGKFSLLCLKPRNLKKKNNFIIFYLPSNLYLKPDLRAQSVGNRKTILTHQQYVLSGTYKSQQKKNN